MIEKAPSGQFTSVLADGMRIDRLPVGLAVGRWWLTFVFSGIDFGAGRPPRSEGFFFEARDILRLDGPAGQITLGPVSGGGDGTRYRVEYELEEKLSWLRVTYMDPRAQPDSETIMLAGPVPEGGRS